jgi:hypothetical protein
MRSVIKELTKRKGRKRRYIQIEETLIVSEVLDLITEKEGSSCRDSETPTKRVRAKRRYSRCSKTRYNSRTYKVEIKDTDNSDDS